MATQSEEYAHRLNAPLVRALMWGARIPSLYELAERVGVDRSQLTRAYRQETAPSLKMLRGLGALWPDVPIAALVKEAGDPEAEPAALGLRPEHLADLEAERAAGHQPVPWAAPAAEPAPPGG